MYHKKLREIKLIKYKAMKQNKKFIIKIKIKHFLSVALQISPKPTVFLYSQKTLTRHHSDSLLPTSYFLFHLFCSPITKLEYKFFHKYHIPVKIKEKRIIKIKHDQIFVQTISFTFTILFRPQAIEWVVISWITYIIINV